MIAEPSVFSLSVYAHLEADLRPIIIATLTSQIDPRTGAMIRGSTPKLFSLNRLLTVLLCFLNQPASVRRLS